MNSESQFASLEIMCRERAALAKKEMEYWLAEAEELKRFKESSGPSREREREREYPPCNPTGAQKPTITELTRVD